MTGSDDLSAVCADAAAPSIAARWWPSIVAALLGVIIIGGVGFMPGVAHEAAHDTRHTMAFPCH